MSWKWDRGYKGQFDPLDDQAEYANPLDVSQAIDRGRAHEAARAAENQELDNLRRDPSVAAIVRDRLKPGLGRTPGIPLKCGSRLYGRELAFGIVRGHVELISISRGNDGLRGVEHRLTGNDTEDALLLPCRCELPPHLGPDLEAYAARRAAEESRAGSRRTRLWLYRAALKTLITGDTRRGVQLHTQT